MSSSKATAAPVTATTKTVTTPATTATAEQRRTATASTRTREGSNSSQLCSYTHRICLQNRLEGSDYCIRHILSDKNAPFKQCSYIHPQSNKRCPNAARRTERKDSTLCPWHIKKLCLKRRQNEKLLIQRSKQDRQQTGPLSPGGTPISLPSVLQNLEHFCPEEHEKIRRKIFWVRQEDDTVAASDELCQKVVEAAANLNESDDEFHNPPIEQTLRNDVLESDPESVDSDQEDPLKHAGVYTAEEVSVILSEKMHRLQHLYTEQFSYLRYLLRERHRRYTQLFIAETKSHPESQKVTNADDLAKLRAMKKYHRYQGKEYLLKRQAKERHKLLQPSDRSSPPRTLATCIFAKDDVKCDNSALPATHYCRIRKLKHIAYCIFLYFFHPFIFVRRFFRQIQLQFVLMFTHNFSLFLFL